MTRKPKINADQILSNAQLYLTIAEPDTQTFLEAFDILAHCRYLIAAHQAWRPASSQKQAPAL